MDFQLTKAIRTDFWIVVCTLLLAGNAHAHRVSVFAWVQGDTVHVESKFAGGKKVKQGKITVFDSKGKRLLEGLTDPLGKFSFNAPQEKALKIVLDAGMGHRAEWIVNSEDFQGVGPEKEMKVDGLETDEKKQNKGAPGSVTNDMIELAVERALDRKLAPIMKMLSEAQEKRVTLKDILAGIGYILGLIGLAAYFHYRRRSAGTGMEKE